MKNKFASRAKITERQFRYIIQLFCLDLDASQISIITGINRNTINRYMKEIRLRILRHCLSESADCLPDALDMENATSGRSPEDLSGNPLVLAITHEKGKIYSRLLPQNLCAAIRDVWVKKKKGEECFFGKSLRSYNGLIDLPKMKYVRINAEDQNGEGRRNGIDVCQGFWGIARSRLQRFRGLQRSTLLIHLKECEFRYNYNRNELLDILLALFKKEPLFQRPEGDGINELTRKDSPVTRARTPGVD